MTLQAFLKVLREQSVVVVLAVGLTMLGAGAVSLLRPAHYTATIQMYVSAQISDDQQAAYAGAQLSAQRVKSYTELLTGERVSSEVIGRLGLDVAPAALAKQVTATSTLDSVLIDVAVTDTSAPRAAQLVNTIGDEFPQLVAEIERPTTTDATAPVVVRVVEPAAVPVTPTSTGLSVALAVGLLAGSALGVGAALARNALDTSVRSPEQLREASNAPNLGIVADDPSAPTWPLTDRADPHSPHAEAFRRLRVNLRFLDADEPPRVIAVTSAVAGEGKTTTLLELAIAMSTSGGRVLVIGADLRCPNVTEYLGLDRSVGLTDLLAGRLSFRQLIQPCGGGIDVLGSGPLPPNPSELLASPQMRDLLTGLRSAYDAVLVDTPPLLPVTDAAALAPATDGVILVCRYGTTTRAQVVAGASALQAVSARVLGTVLTRVPASGPRAYAKYNAYYRTQQPVLRMQRS